MSDFFRELRLAARRLRSTPVFMAVSILTLALGIGASTAVFSMVNGALLKPLPYESGRQLLRIRQPTATNPVAGLSVLEVDDLRAQATSFTGVAEYHSMPFQFYGKGEPQRVQTGVVSDTFFDLLGVRPMLGRGFRPGEDAIGAPNVILLGYRYWMDTFAGDSAVIGSTFTMNDRSGTIIGVLPPLPVYPDNNDIWMPAGQCPFRSAPGTVDNRLARMVQAFAVVKPGVPLERVRPDLERLSSNLRGAYPEAYPEAQRRRLEATSVWSELTGPARPLLLTLLGCSVFVLVVATANFANLTLARQLRRKQELALRTALGASRRDLFRQLVTESVLVTSASAALGIALAYGGLGVLRVFVGRVSARAGEVAIDPTVLAFAAVVSVAVGLVAATVPMWRMTTRLNDELRGGSSTSASSRFDGRVRAVLVATQVAVAFVVLVGAGLMINSLLRLQAVDGGFNAANVLSARVDLNWSRYNAGGPIREFADQLVARMAQEPGVQAVAVSNDFPLNSTVAGTNPFLIRGRDAGTEPPTADITVVSPDYFDVIGVSLLRGRVFTASDVNPQGTPAIISNRLATTYWANSDPIGQEISINNGQTWVTIVGVVGDVHQAGPAQSVTDQIYLPFSIIPVRDLRIVMRTARDPALLSVPLRNAIRALDPLQPVVSVYTLAQLRGQQLTQPRVATLLIVVFGITALVITVGGLGGVVAHTVGHRSTEIAIRLALGSSRPSVVWTVTRGAMLVVMAGLVTGLLGVFVSSRFIDTLLFGISGLDPITLVAVAAFLATISAAACVMPAVRAARMEPSNALRAR